MGVKALIFELKLHDRPSAEIDDYLRGLCVEYHNGPASSLRVGSNGGQ